MKTWIVLLCCALAGGCATAPSPPPAAALFDDALFRPPSVRIDAADVLATSPAMRRYLDGELTGELRSRGRQQGLFAALYGKGQLQLEYDSAMTRNAAEAFDARAGNCLSLVLMTAAFAKDLGLTVRFQSVFAEETWSRSGDIYYAIGHVNLTLGRKQVDGGFGKSETDLMTIDFLPPRNLRGLHTMVIGEDRIIAMYMNNRAVEALTAGQLDDAYGWARAAIRQDSKFLSAYNTVGAIYQRHRNPEAALRILAYVLAQEPGNTRVMANLALVLADLGRSAEADALNARRAQLEPYPPFSFFNQGREAMKAGDIAKARDLFAKEVDRAAYYHEFHFWLALAYMGLGDTDNAKKHLAIARETSTTRSDHDLYAAKLDRMKTYHPGRISSATVTN